MTVKQLLDVLFLENITQFKINHEEKPLTIILSLYKDNVIKEVIIECDNTLIDHIDYNYVFNDDNLLQSFPEVISNIPYKAQYINVCLNIIIKEVK